MAVLTTQQPMKAAFLRSGYDFPSDNQQEAATQTYLIGAVLVYSAGTIAEASANPTNILGVAEQNGSNLSSAGLLVGGGPRYIEANRGIVFEANLASTTAGDPDQVHTLAQTDVGSYFGIAKSTTNKFWYINFSDVVNTRVVVVGLRDAVGTVGGRVYFKFRGSMVYDN